MLKTAKKTAWTWVELSSGEGHGILSMRQRTKFNNQDYRGGRGTICFLLKKLTLFPLRRRQCECQHLMSRSIDKPRIPGQQYLQLLRWFSHPGLPKIMFKIISAVEMVLPSRATENYV